MERVREEAGEGRQAHGGVGKPCQGAWALFWRWWEAVGGFSVGGDKMRFAFEKVLLAAEFQKMGSREVSLKAARPVKGLLQQAWWEIEECRLTQGSGMVKVSDARVTIVCYNPIPHPQVSPELQTCWKTVSPGCGVSSDISDSISPKLSSSLKPSCSNLHLFPHTPSLFTTLMSTQVPWPEIGKSSFWIPLSFLLFPCWASQYVLLVLSLTISHMYIFSSPGSVCLAQVASYFSTGYCSSLLSGLWDSILFSFQVCLPHKCWHDVSEM